MANVFDQFDQAVPAVAAPPRQAAAAANPFDQFDAPSEPSTLSDIGKGAVRGVASGITSMPAVDPTMGLGGAEQEFAGMQHRLREGVEKLPSPSTKGGKIAESAGEFVGNPLSYVGPGGLAAKAGVAAISGLGSGAAGELAEGLGVGKTGTGVSRFLGAVAGGASAGALVAKGMKTVAGASLPTKADIKASAKESYEQIKNNRLTVEPSSFENLSQDIKDSLKKDNLYSVEMNPGSQVSTALGLLGESKGDISELMNIHSKLGKVKPSTGEHFDAALTTRLKIQQYLDNVPSGDILTGNAQFTKDMWSHARDSWKSKVNLENLEMAGEMAERQAGVSGTGANIINTIRQRVRGILESEKKSRSLSPEVKEEMNRLVMGTWATNSARFAGKYGPSGAVSGIFALLSATVAGPTVAAGIAVSGLVARYLGRFLTQSQLSDIMKLVRSESPIGKASGYRKAVESAKEFQMASPLRAGASSLMLDQIPDEGR